MWTTVPLLQAVCPSPESQAVHQPQLGSGVVVKLDIRTSHLE